MDASLKELMSLVREVNPESRKKGTYFDFAIGKLYDEKTKLLKLIIESFAYLLSPESNTNNACSSFQ